MQSILDFLGSFFSNVTNFIKLQYEYVVNAIYNLFMFISDIIVFCVDGILFVLGSYFSVLIQFFQNSITFFSVWFESYIDYCKYYYWHFVDRIYDMVVYFMKFSFYWLLRLLDYSMNLMFDISIYCLELLPDVTLPAGFEVGMQYFLGFGMILNSFFPFAEMIGFICIVLIVRVLAFSFKFLPYVGGVVR